MELKQKRHWKKKLAGKKWVTFLFTFRRCLACSLYAISEIRESNQRLFPSMSSFNSPLLASSPPCHRIKHTPYLFYFIFIIIHPPEKRHLGYLWLITRSQPSLWLIFMTEMSSLGRYKWHEKTHAAEKGRGEGKWRREEGRKSLLAFWHLLAFICAAFPEHGSKLGACMRTWAPL